MVYYFHVRRIPNLLEMIMAQGFPAWAEEGISRATGVVRLILILVQNDREVKKQKKTPKKTKTKKRHQCPRAARLCRGLLFRDISMTQKSSEQVTIDVRM